MPLSAEQKQKAIAALDALIEEPDSLATNFNTPAKKAHNELTEEERVYARNALLYAHLKHAQEMNPEANIPIPASLLRALAEA